MGDRVLQPPISRATAAPPEPAAGPRVQDELRALIRVSSAVAAATHLEEVLEAIAEESCSVLRASSVSLSRWERAQNRLRTLINVGALADGEERWPAEELWSLEDFPHIPGLLERGTSYVVDLADPAVPEAERAVLRQLGKSSCLRVPIVCDGRTWGKLEVFSDADSPAFTVDDAPFTEALANQAALAIGRAELFTRLAALAYEDPLTGLANRRALEDRLEDAVARAASSGGRVGLLFCDLDGLKELNDSDGHGCGDEALVRVAAALTGAAAAYPGAFISRIGGDEFCVLLDGHGAAAARALALDAERRLLSPADRPLTMSSGAAELQHPGQRPADLFRAADAAQYVAKRAGRGRVYVAEAGAVAVAGARAQASGGRRRLRDAGREASLLPARVLATLEGELAGALAQDRLEAVAVAFADAFEASGWAISHRPPGDDRLHTLFEGGRRAHRVSGVPSLRFSAQGDYYELAEYPATAAILARGGSFRLAVDDEGADPAEVAVLRRTGHQAVVAAAVVHEGAGWLVELYADARTGPVHEAQAELRLLMGEALRAARR